MMLLNQKNMNYINKFIYTIFLLTSSVCLSQENTSENRIKVGWDFFGGW